jgi:hypothetical protein
MTKISTVVNFCTTDYRFLRFCIEEAKKFSQQIVIPVCTHFFNGEPENRILLDRVYREHPDVQFIEFAYGEEPYGIYSPLTSADEDWAHYWHSTARYVGFQFVGQCNEVLFLDVDEIVDGKRFIDWLGTFNVEDFNALRFESYFYFREPSYRAKEQFPLNALLVKKQAIDSPEMILDVLERKGLYDQIEGPKRSHLRGLDQQPLVHHYSWVRTPEELKQKVCTWGHRHDKEWLELIEKELSVPFSGTDLIHGFEYEKVDPVHEVFLEKSHPHVERVTKQSLFEAVIQKML